MSTSFFTKVFSALLIVMLALGSLPVTPARAATINVNITTDTVANDTNCSLREAIVAANNDVAFFGCSSGAGADTIILTSGSTYALNLTTAGAGDLDITSNITISASGATVAIIDPNAPAFNERVFDVAGGGTPGTLTLDTIRITTAITANAGAAVQSAGTLIVQDNSEFISNQTNAGAGGSNGGAINITGGTASISNSTFSGNTATGDGGAISVSGGTLTVTNVTFTNSTASNSGDSGGAIYHNAATLLTVTNSTFTGNRATAGDGGAIITNNNASSLTITGSTFTSNTSTDDGGAISNVAEPTRISNSTFTGNSITSSTGNAAVGGAIRNEGAADDTRITLSTFTNNSVTHSGNENVQGGAIANEGSGFTLANVTFSGNSVSETNAGGGGNAQGGAIWSDANSTIHNVTFSGNTATQAGSGAADGGNLYRNGGTVTVRNTILVSGTENGAAGNCGGILGGAALNASFADNISTIDCGAAVTTGSPNLSALTGSPQYFPLNTGSPAISAGDSTICQQGTSTNDTSQNGEDRITAVTDTTCDIGSYETPAKVATTTTITADTPDPSVTGQQVSVTVTVTGGSPTGTVNITGADTNCSITLAAGTGSCNVTFTSVGAKTLTANYTGDSGHDVSSDTEAHQVNQAATTTTITSDLPDPSVVGQSVTVNYTVVVNAPGAGTPTGNVTVTDGVNSCVGTVAAGTCNLTLTTAGARTLTATYAGDANFATSSSAGEAHQVNQASTTTTITSDLPDPSVVGQSVTVNYTVVVNAPGAGTPTGNVTVTDGVDSCTATVAAGTCNLTLTTAGARTLTATYAGDANFATSSSAGEAHQVNQAATTTTITSDLPDPSVFGQSVTVNFTVVANAPGSGTPTGNVTVTDGVDSCTATVAAGTCNLTLTTLGARTLTATYAGDANFTTSNDTEAHQVNQATPSISATGGSFTFDSNSHAATGFAYGIGGIGDVLTPAVTFIYTGSGTTVYGPSATAPTNAGAYDVAVNFAGNTNYTSATTTTTITIGLANQTITVTTSAPTAAVNGSSFNVAATASSGLPVSISVSGVCTVADLDGSVSDGDATVTMTSGTGTCSVFYDQAGNANFNPAPQVQENVTATDSPVITSANNASFDLGFVGTFNITATGNPSTMVISITGTLPTGIIFTDNGNGTASLSGTPAAGTAGVYNLVLTANNGVNPNGTQNFTLTVRNGPVTNNVNSLPDTGDGSVTENESVATTLGITQLTVEFSQDVYDVPASTTDPDEVDNPANYILVRSTTGVFNTLSCAGGVVAPDIINPIASVTYSNGGGSGPFIATVTLSAPLTTDGYYRLFVCGTTSIVDAVNNGLILAGDGTTPGTDFTRNFVLAVPAAGGGGGGGARRDDAKLAVAALPATGFAPGRITALPIQPDELAYSSLGDLWIEIPSLGIKTSIIGVPQTEDGEWDVTWLANNVGWLNGTAFPTWEGNSVVTAHVTNADGVDGPFANLKKLKYGDQIIIHLYGQKYIFEVRNSRLTRPFTTSFAFEDLQDASYLTLITCQTYLPKSDTYMHRRVIRAVLISVENE